MVVSCGKSDKGKENNSNAKEFVDSHHKYMKTRHSLFHIQFRFLSKKS